ncbi:hypothetical protein SFRURICE_003664 [Spodoptera frugiperda]|nr:hypothetical protein SFRURICE_003664 [Spodoptera frugiperda]
MRSRRERFRRSDCLVHSSRPIRAPNAHSFRFRSTLSQLVLRKSQLRCVEITQRNLRKLKLSSTIIGFTIFAVPRLEIVVYRPRWRLADPGERRMRANGPLIMLASRSGSDVGGDYFGDLLNRQFCLCVLFPDLPPTPQPTRMALNLTKSKRKGVRRSDWPARMNQPIRAPYAVSFRSR